uniref:Uncharacterized protein n=1 Tax=Anguilla anguilla TaxID=7936 RepID=A0A0E9RKZ2_ANGAN
MKCHHLYHQLFLNTCFYCVSSTPSLLLLLQFLGLYVDGQPLVVN